MQYRRFGRTGLPVSALGFGAMRLPTRGSESDVDQDAALELMRYAFDRGVNYVDTAYVYHGGRSEEIVGRAVAGGYRDRVRIATKLPVWQIQTRDDCQRIFDEQLRRLQTERIDFYLLHCLHKASWAKMREVGVLAWAESLRAAGRIGEFGFSFHDSYDAFTEIVDGYDWTFCQIQYNFVNEDVQAGTKGLAYAAARGLAVVIMEPLFGGTLANPPPAVEEIYRSPPVPVRPADLALRWLWNKPEVSLVLSGMNQRAQVEQNIASAVQSGVGRLTSDEAALVGRLQEKYRDLSPIPCTRCGYCLPCPHGVNIPRNFELLNNARVFGGSSGLLCRNLYLLLPEAERASACEFCGTCEERCPQHIDIPAQLRAVHQQFQPSP